MTLDQLNNLVRIGQLKPEPRDQHECAGLLRSAIIRIRDSKQAVLSVESQFDLAYNAAHSAALCALRYSDYRSENRYIVFQSLEHTLGFEPAQWLLFDLAHKKRNLSEYEGELDVTESFVHELIESVEHLIAQVIALDAEWMQTS